VALFTGLVRNELQKTWRSRWIVFAVMAGIFVLIAGGLYIYYVASQHRWSPPPPVAWQDTLRQDIASNQQQLIDMQQFQQQVCNPSDPKCPPQGAQPPDLSQQIAMIKQQIADDQYLLDNNIAPVQSFSITIAAVFGLGGIVMFLLLRIFGWLASEQIAGERSDRTIAILLSRPMSRNQLLLAKAVASFLISLGVVVVSFLVIYAITSFIEGSLGPVTGQVGIAVDGSKSLRGSNLVAMPVYLFVLMCFGGAMLGVLCVQGMSLLISAVFGRWAAIGITLAVLFGAPLVSTVVTVIIYAISQDFSKAHFLNYLFFNVLAPVSALTPVFGSGPGPSGAGGTGIGEFQFQLAVLGAWTVAFFAAAWLLFRRKQEAS
jgi:ABC-2 type transport system permease protein